MANRETKSSTYPKTDATKVIQEYLTRALPLSVIVDAYCTGRQEPVAKHVKEHYNADPGDCIGLRLNVRDAIQNIALSVSPFKTLAELPSYSELIQAHGKEVADVIIAEREGWQDLFLRLRVTEQDLARIGKGSEEIDSNKVLAEELRKAIFDIELMIETNQVTDGPRNQKERAEQAERHALVGRLTKIRRALYRSKDVIENLESGQ